MSGNQRYQPYAGNPARLNTYHGPKRQLLGNHTAGRAAPSWRSNAIPEEAAAAQAAAKRVTIRNLSGSKILLSCLPNDVSESDITDLFTKTVGPLSECFLIHNSAGQSKGMAVITFQKSTDAKVAKQKYDGKIVDRRRPIKIELIVDDLPNPDASTAARPRAQQPVSLLDRLAVSTTPAASSTSVHQRIAPATTTAPKPHLVARVQPNPGPDQIVHQLPRQQAAAASIMAAQQTQHPKLRQRKGAKRIRKYLPRGTGAGVQQQQQSVSFYVGSLSSSSLGGKGRAAAAGVDGNGNGVAGEGKRAKVKVKSLAELDAEMEEYSTARENMDL